MTDDQGRVLAILMRRHEAKVARVTMGGQGLPKDWAHVFLDPHDEHRGFASINNGGCGIDPEGRVSS